MKPVPKAPPHLTEPTRNWWRTCVKDYELEAHHLRILQAAAECWDRLQAARSTIDREGLTFTDDRGNCRAHPCVAIERDCRIGFARLVRELDMDIEPPRGDRIGPIGLRSNWRL